MFYPSFKIPTTQISGAIPVMFDSVLTCASFDDFRLTDGKQTYKVNNQIYIWVRYMCGF